MDQPSDIFTRVAESRLSRRDMMKASVVAGGLVWSAPLLLSGKAFAQIDGCCAGSTVTVTLDATLAPGCAATLCLSESFACDADIVDCLDSLIIAEFTSNPNAANTGIHIDLTGGVTVLGVGVRTDHATNNCIVEEMDPATCTIPNSTTQITIDSPTEINISFNENTFGQLVQVELTLCLPQTLTAFC